jgi:hypothetical protein
MRVYETRVGWGVKMKKVEAHSDRKLLEIRGRVNRSKSSGIGDPALDAERQGLATGVQACADLEMQDASSVGADG